MKPLLSLLLWGLGASALYCPQLQADEIRVAVAANFKDTLRQIGQAFTARTGHTLVISAAATGVLYAQISQGAPFDLLLSADRATPRQLEQEGKGSERFTYAIGRLGLWRKGGPAPDEGTLRRWQGNLAIANPATAPYGAAAMATLSSLNMDPRRYRLLTATNISQTWQFVATGNAELGFVAWASLVTAGKTGEAWAVPDRLHPAIEQQGLILHKRQAVDALVAWLKGPGQRQISQAGYRLP